MIAPPPPPRGSKHGATPPQDTGINVQIEVDEVYGAVMVTPTGKDTEARR